MFVKEITRRKLDSANLT